MSFFDETVLTADKFIKTICFIDDQPVFNKNEDPVNEDIDHRLYADVITKAFAPKRKACCFYQYKHASEEADVLELANSSDINVIDWRIVIPETEILISIQNNVVLDEPPEATPQDKETLKDSPLNTKDPESFVQNEEKDIEEMESRGKYALKLIEKILLKSFSVPKVIIILTAEYNSDSIFNPIQEKLKEIGIENESNRDELWFQNEKFRISIYFKESLNTKYLSEEVKNKIIPTASLPDMLNFEFAKLVNGLVLKTAIDCIGEVRANTFSLIGSYNNNLDPAYLTHKSLLPNTHDAEEHLIEIIGSDIKAIIKDSGIIENLRDNILTQYLEERYNEQDYEFFVPEKEKFPSLKIPERISQAILKSMVNNGIENTFFGKDQSRDEQILFSSNCHRYLTVIFALNAASARNSDIQFAILTTIKPTYQIQKFLLSQGTILKEEKNQNYWLCIQPKCDSIRIETNKRAFMFLRVYTVPNDKVFHVVLNSNDGPLYLKISYKVYSSKSFEFFKDSHGNVSSFKENSLIKFKRGDGQNMVWIAELKNDYSQSIANTFAVELSRVGLDLSEWLRRSSSI